MVKHTIRRATLMAVGAASLWSALLAIDGPRWLASIAVGIFLAASHHNAGWVALAWARALLTGPYYTDGTPEKDRWRLTDVEMRRSVRAVAIWEDDYDRAVGAVDVAAHAAGVKSPYLHIGRRMSAAAFAAGPRPDDTVVCVSIEMLDPARSQDLHRVLVAELGLARRRVPLWGSVAAAAAVCVWTLLATSWG